MKTSESNPFEVDFLDNMVLKHASILFYGSTKIKFY